MAKQVKVTVYTDDNKETSVIVNEDEAREYEDLAFKSQNIVCVNVKES